jgi:SAM-dependent methyltransferase
VEVSFGVADVRDLSALGSRRFDAVVSCDNSLSHLLTEADLVRGLASIRDRLRPGGLLVASIRDYDELLGGGPAPALRHGQGSGPDDRGRPPGTLPQVFDSPQGRRVVVQVWTWDPVDPVYDLELFLLLEHGEGWRASSFQGRYRAYRRSDVDAALAGAGFTEPRWLMPEDSGYHQPLVRARAPG